MDGFGGRKRADCDVNFSVWHERKLGVCENGFVEATLLQRQILFSLSIRHADLPESSVRYVGTVVDDVIKTGSEVNEKSQ